MMTPPGLRRRGSGFLMVAFLLILHSPYTRPVSAATPARFDSTALRAAAERPVTILIVYYSRTGHTQQLAEAVAVGVRSIPDVVGVVKSVEAVTREDLQRAEGIILGSPTYYANMAGPMKTFIDNWGLTYQVSLTDKVGGAFATGGGATGGKEHVVISLLLAMLNQGMMVVGPWYEQGARGVGAFGVSVVTRSPEADLTEGERGEARQLGVRVARIAQRMRLVRP